MNIILYICTSLRKYSKKNQDPLTICDFEYGRRLVLNLTTYDQELKLSK